MVAQDVVIACSTDNNCAAWREGSDEQLWNISIENVSAFIGLDNNSQTVYRREGVRYVILAFHSAVNLDTGETRFASTYAEQQANEQLLQQYCAANEAKCSSGTHKS